MKNGSSGNVVGSGKADNSGDAESLPSMGTREVARPKDPEDGSDRSGDVVSRPGEHVTERS